MHRNTTKSLQGRTVVATCLCVIAKDLLRPYIQQLIGGECTELLWTSAVLFQMNIWIMQAHLPSYNSDICVLPTVLFSR